MARQYNMRISINQFRIYRAEQMVIFIFIQMSNSLINNIPHGIECFRNHMKSL